MTVRGYQLGVDWSRTGDYTGTLEDVTSYVAKDDVLTVSWGRDTSQAGTAATAGSMDFALVNTDRKFSPEYTASPIAGRILPGTPAQLLATGPTGQTYPLIKGVIDTLDSDPLSAARTFTATVLDAWGRPGAESLSTPLYTGVRTGTAVGYVLDAIGWTGGRDIDAGVSVLPYWWAEGVDAATAIEQLVSCEGPSAIAYVAGGTFVFRDRHARVVRAASSTSQATFTGALTTAGPGGAYRIGRDRQYQHGLTNIANQVSWEIQQRAALPAAEVWSTDAPITLAANETVVIEAASSDPFYNATADYTVTGSVTVTLSRTSGQAVTVTVAAGGAPAIVTRLAVLATPLPVARTVKVMASDAGSIGTFEAQQWPGETPPFINAYDAQAIATRIVAIYAQPRPAVTIEIANLDAAGTYLTQILTRAIGDRITIRDDDIGINTDFIIERVTHSILAFSVHRVRWECQVPEPTQPANVFTFDVAGKGFDQGYFGVTGIDSATTMFRFDTAGQGFDQGAFAS
jgi:hypothetical protein